MKEVNSLKKKANERIQRKIENKTENMKKL